MEDTLYFGPWTTVGTFVPRYATCTWVLVRVPSGRFGFGPGTVQGTLAGWPAHYSNRHLRGFRWFESQQDARDAIEAMA